MPSQHLVQKDNHYTQGFHGLRNPIAIKFLIDVEFLFSPISTGLVTSLFSKILSSVKMYP